MLGGQSNEKLDNALAAGAADLPGELTGSGPTFERPLQFSGRLPGEPV